MGTYRLPLINGRVSGGEYRGEGTVSTADPAGYVTVETPARGWYGGAPLTCYVAEGSVLEVGQVCQVYAVRTVARGWGFFPAEVYVTRAVPAKCAGCGEYWPCSDSARRDISGRERAKHHR